VGCVCRHTFRGGGERSFSKYAVLTQEFPAFLARVKERCPATETSPEAVSQPADGETDLSTAVGTRGFKFLPGDKFGEIVKERHVLKTSVSRYRGDCSITGEEKTSDESGDEKTK
jgi:hypothetical protein